ARGEERRAFAVACCLAIFNQATASTAIINYAPKLLQRMGGMSASGSLAFTFIIAITKVLGVSAGLLLVDTVGRPPLLIWGALGCC
ncbi:MFS domain-containing protein, partial [Haematococcus lacustris]